MSRKILLVIPPATGLILLTVVFIDLYQLKAGTIEVQSMLDREFIILVFGFISSAVLFWVSLRWIFKSDWRSVFLAFLSILAFFALFIFSGLSGGAFLNAT